jgi:hypothetical protein
MKKPSEPSLIGSLTSYIYLVPVSLSRIQHNNHKLMTIKVKESNIEKKAIKFEGELEINIANAINNRKGASSIPYFILFILSSLNI